MGSFLPFCELFGIIDLSSLSIGHRQCSVRASPGPFECLVFSAARASLAIMARFSWVCTRTILVLATLEERPDEPRALCYREKLPQAWSNHCIHAFYFRKALGLAILFQEVKKWSRK